MPDEQGTPLTAADVLRRYGEEYLPAFVGVALDHVNVRGIFGEYPLDVAACRGDVAEVRALLDGGAHIDARGEHGHTALHEAVSQGHVEVVRLLLSRGASRAERNDWGRTALDLARSMGRAEIAALLEVPDGR